VIRGDKRPLKMPHPVEPPPEEKFPGQHEGERLADWLNTKPKTEDHERVIALLRLLTESVEVQVATGIKDAVRLHAVARPFYERIRELISPYSFAPDLRLTWQGTPLSAPLWGDAYGVREAVMAIDRIIRFGCFSRLRRCEGCERWMFAKRSDNTTCGTKCRAKKMRKALPPEKIEERKQKAKERYRINKGRRHGKR
jgi:hypothetical protein